SNLLDGTVLEHDRAKLHWELLERRIERCESVPRIRHRRPGLAVVAPEDADAHRQPRDVSPCGRLHVRRVRHGWPRSRLEEASPLSKCVTRLGRVAPMTRKVPVASNA